MIGLHGEKRPANPIANAVHVAKLATGEAEEQYVDTTKQAGGRQGGQARAGALTPEQRHQIAKDGAAARRPVSAALSPLARWNRRGTCARCSGSPPAHGLSVESTALLSPEGWFFTGGYRRQMAHF